MTQEQRQVLIDSTCPFCGTARPVLWRQPGKGWIVKCVDGCSASIKYYISAEGALAVWNRRPRQDRPAIVCLCGSTRFGEAFRDANLRETLAGKIVLSIGCNMKSDTEIFGHLSPDEQAAIKAKLDELHLRKIDLADEVLVLNVGGYVGESTRREIQYAEERDKVIRWLEPVD